MEVKIRIIHIQANNFRVSCSQTFLWAILSVPSPFHRPDAGVAPVFDLRFVRKKLAAFLFPALFGIT